MLLSSLALGFLIQGQDPIVPIVRPGKDGRGRDPWVFRALFDDRSRMVILALKPGIWMAFNPDTCGVHEVWQGDIDFRGKVWDFSQDNSRPKGTLLYSSPSKIELVPLGETKEPTAPQPLSNAPEYKINTEDWDRVFMAFDEMGRKSRLRVELRDSTGKIAQWFESATSVEGDSHWQWNFKQLMVKPGTYTVKFYDPKNTGKQIRGIRVFGDRPVWFNPDGTRATVKWRGYEFVKTKPSEKKFYDKGNGVVLKYDVVLSSGKVMSVRHRPEIRSEASNVYWYETIETSGPKGVQALFRRYGAEKNVSGGLADKPVTITTGSFLLFSYTKDGSVKGGTK